MANSSPVCLNCGTSLHGKFCSDCGQKVIEHKERTVRYFLIQFLGSAFFLENNFLKNLWTLVVKPGQLTIDFIEGRRKRWMTPISIFLLINLFYFWFTPLTDLNLSLREQLFQFHHQRLAKYMVDQKLKSENLSMDELSDLYNAKSTAYSNTLIILHIPILALFLFFIFYKKDLFYADHFIFALHFLSFVLFAAMIQAGLIYFATWSGLFKTKVWSMSSWLFFALILIYMELGIKKVYQQKFLASVIFTVPVIIGFIVSHFIYRTLLFLITFSLI